MLPSQWYGERVYNGFRETSLRTPAYEHQLTNTSVKASTDPEETVNNDIWNRSIACFNDWISFSSSFYTSSAFIAKRPTDPCFLSAWRQETWKRSTPCRHILHSFSIVRQIFKRYVEHILSINSTVLEIYTFRKYVNYGGNKKLRGNGRWGMRNIIDILQHVRKRRS